jgi:hypothetical protein
MIIALCIVGSIFLASIVHIVSGLQNLHRPVTAYFIYTSVFLMGGVAVSPFYHSRGVSLSSNLYILNAPNGAKSRSNRLGGTSEILVFNEKWNLLSTYHVPKSQTCEIRRIDQNDLALSQNVNPD